MYEEYLRALLEPLGVYRFEESGIIRFGDLPLGFHQSEHMLIAQPGDAMVKFQNLFPGDIMEQPLPETPLHQNPGLIRFPKAHARQIFLHGRIFRIKVEAHNMEISRFPIGAPV